MTCKMDEFIDANEKQNTEQTIAILPSYRASLRFFIGVIFPFSSPLDPKCRAYTFRPLLGSV